MDGLSSAAAIAQFVLTTTKIVWELKKFYDGTKIVQSIIDGLVKDVEGLTLVLESMRKTFADLARGANEAELDPYWRSVHNALDDGNKVLLQFEEVLATIDRPGKIWVGGVKKLRFESARQQIETYRQHIQSYRDILNLCLQTLIFWNQVETKESTNMLVVDLADLHKSVDQNARYMNEKLDRLVQLAISQPEEAQLPAMRRLRECVRSAATVVSTASTVVASDVMSIMPPSEFELLFAEDRGPTIGRWIEAQGPYSYDETGSNPKSITEATDLVDSDDEAESDSEIEIELNRAILEETVQLLKKGSLTEGEELLQDRMMALETRPRPGAAAQVKHPYLYREIQVALASLSFEKGDLKAADRRAQSAYKGFKKLRDADQELTCLRLLARIAKAKGSDSYFLAYTKLCAKLEGTGRTTTLDFTQEPLSRLAVTSPTTALQSRDEASPNSHAEDHYFQPSSAGLRPAQPRTALGPASAITTGIYEDAKEYPAMHSICTAEMEAHSNEINVARRPQTDLRNRSITSSSNSTRDSEPTTQMSPRSSIDLQSEVSSAATPPTEFSAMSPRRPYGSRESTHDSLHMIQSSTTAPKIYTEPEVMKPTPLNLLTKPTRQRTNSNPPVDSQKESAMRGQPIQVQQRRQPEDTIGVAWTVNDTSSQHKKSAESVATDSKQAKKFLNRFWSKSNAADDSSAAKAETNLSPTLPENSITQSPTDSTIENNWGRVKKSSKDEGVAVQTPPASTEESTTRKRKVVCVGDSAVGKTSIISRHRDGTWREVKSRPKTTKSAPTIRQSQPTLSAPYTISKIRPRDGKPVELTFWDTPGQDSGYDHNRLPCYPDTSVILACFAMDDSKSLEDVEKFWMPEVRAHCPDVPIILVGCKSDLHHKSTVTGGEAEVVRSRIGALIYQECSAYTGYGIEKVFECAAVTSCAFDEQKSKQLQGSAASQAPRTVNDKAELASQPKTIEGKPSNWMGAATGGSAWGITA